MGACAQILVHSRCERHLYDTCKTKELKGGQRERERERKREGERERAESVRLKGEIRSTYETLEVQDK